MQGRIDKEIFIVAYTAYTDEESACNVAGMDYFCKFPLFFLINYRYVSLVPKPAPITAITAILKDIDLKI
jgi:hypothetical protein